VKGDKNNFNNDKLSGIIKIAGKYIRKKTKNNAIVLTDHLKVL
jgi:hypothetical protein